MLKIRDTLFKLDCVAKINLTMKPSIITAQAHAPHPSNLIIFLVFFSTLPPICVLCSYSSWITLASVKDFHRIHRIPVSYGTSDTKIAFRLKSNGLTTTLSRLVAFGLFLSLSKQTVYNRAVEDSVELNL